MHHSIGPATGLADDGVWLLVYLGDTGKASRFDSSARGLKPWYTPPVTPWVIRDGTVEKLPSAFAEEYTQTPTVAWRAKSIGEIAGTVRTVGRNGTTAGKTAFVTIHEACHTVYTTHTLHNPML